MPKIALLVFLSLLLSVFAAAQDAAVDDAASIVAPGIARFPYTKAPAKDPEIIGDEPASLISTSTYAFSAQSGIALEDMSDPTTRLIAPGSDNNVSTIRDIGFLYRYDGDYFTTFGVGANGLLRLGGAVGSQGNNANALGSAAFSPKIAPYWDDLCVGNNGKVHFKVVPGPVGTRKLVIEWKNIKVPRGTTCNGTESGNATFQLWLYDRTGVIQFVYGNGMTTAAAANNGYSVGIQSGVATNFASVTTATNSVSYTTANDAQFDPITPGTSYLFSPNVPAAATGLSASAPGQSTVTINWTDNANDETGYLVRRTTDMVNFYFVSGTMPPNSTTFTDTGLIAGTQYFYFVNAVTDGAFGPDASLMVTTPPPRVISSTPAGGPWSAPSTWTGGIVPSNFDNVTIAGGATVTIDTAAAVADKVTVAPSASLKFGETAAFRLTVTNDVIIEAGGTLATGGGNANQHILSVGGSLTNNGTLDLCTNNNQAAAGLVFTGTASSAFSGSGPVTDIFTLTINKGARDNILDLAPANFTVQGSATDGPGSGFLFLNGGTFKISGTFSGAHRTFASPVYQVTSNSGLWLNNPNYTITAQNGTAVIIGTLQISAGGYNVGTTPQDGLTLATFSLVTIEGGSLTVSGAMGIRGILPRSTILYYTQTGGTVSTCTVGRVAGPADICFDLGEEGSFSYITLSGGDIIIQNSQDNMVDYDYRNVVRDGSVTNTTVHFGNAMTTGSGIFAAIGKLPNVVISANHSLKGPFPGAEFTVKRVYNLTIEEGAVLQGRCSVAGTQITNNGAIMAADTTFDINPFQHVVYSGTGSALVGTFYVNAHSLTISPEAGNIRVSALIITRAAITNAGKFIVGNGSNDNTVSRIEFDDELGSLDVSPNFDLGPGGLNISYEEGPRTTGPEIPSNRIIPGELNFIGPGPYTIAGGDLTVNTLTLGNGIVATGNNTLTALINISGGGTNSHVDGTLRRRLNSTGSQFFPVGRNGYSPVMLNVSAFAAPSFITLSTVDDTLPWLRPVSALSRYWKIVEEGDVTASVNFQYLAADINGDPNTYRIWRGTGGGTPQEVPFGARSATDITTVAGITDFTGDWGMGATLWDPVSISGRVTTASGNPIRNAMVTLSGGNLSAPVTVLTGSLGTYIFSGIMPGLTYNISASAKRFRFPPGGQNVTPAGNVENIDFAANPQEN